MQSIKLHEATKQFKIANKLAMFFLEKKNVPVKSHSSVISMEQLELLREFSSNKQKVSEVQKEFDKKITAGKKKKDQEAQPQETKEEVKATDKKEEAAGLDEKKPAKEPGKEKAPPKKEVEKPKETKEIEEKIKIKVPSVTEKKPEPPKGEKEDRKKKVPVTPVEKETIPRAPKEKEEDLQKKKDAARLKAIEVKKAGLPKRPRREQPPRFRKREFRKEKPKAVPGKPERKGIKERKREGAAAPPAVPEKKKVEILDLPESIQISDFITVKELCDQLNIKLKNIAGKLKELKKEYVTNQILDIDDARKICKEFNVKVDIVAYEKHVFLDYTKKRDSRQSPRAPVVTVMGHVDHGKTTLLDSLRETRVAAAEAGGITQTIGAYKLNLGTGDIIFIDTPGHEAFTNLRARGAGVTDIVVLVVAANDGVQPQTIEAINHARSAGVPMLVAINKIDLEGADPNRVKQELSQQGVLVEEWGGDIVSVEISAKLKQNLDSLLEMIALVSEMQELKMYPDAPARGTVIESRLDSKLGALGTVLVLDGVLNRGDFFICGNAVGKVKTIFDDKGKTLNQANAPLPVEIMGFEDVPQAGDTFQVVEDIEKARKVIEMRKIRGKEAKEEEMNAEKKSSLQNLLKRMEQDQAKTFPIIIKTDNFGSNEVLEKVLLQKGDENVKIEIIQKGIGNITESDILLASTTGAVIIGFNARAPQKILLLAKTEKVEIKLYNVIYHLTEDIEKALKGEIEPEYVETLIGKVEVLQKFKISKIGIVAGCLVKEGRVTKKSKLKVIRNDDLVFEGGIETLKRVKDEASEVKAGTECGIKIKNFNAIEVGDILEAYETTLKE